MASSDPRLTPPAHSHPELVGGELGPLRSTVPHSTHILLSALMLLFFSVATLLTLQAPWGWWLIPAVIAVPVITITGERYRHQQNEKKARRLLDDELRAVTEGRATGSAG